MLKVGLFLQVLNQGADRTILHSPVQMIHSNHWFQVL